MPTEIIVPRQGWSMEEAVLSAWHKRDGDVVAVGEPVFALESDKAAQDVESMDAGILFLPISAPKAGDIVRPGQCVAYLLAPGEARPVEAKPPLPTAPAPAPSSIPEFSQAPVRSAEPSVRISPRALRVAESLGIDWRQVHGTGRTGRIRERDIRGSAAAPAGRRDDSVLRRTIAERLVSSLRESAPVTLHAEVDATELVAWRHRLKLESGAPGKAAPSYTDLLVMLSARALQRHPVLNSRCERGVFTSSPDIHIGLAVDIGEGLVVPVVRDVLRLDLNGLCARTRDLIERARTRKLSPDELRGGTFTLTNLGAFGIDAFTPILNPPECAILGVGRIHQKPVVIRDAITPRDMMTLSLTFDHRACDGAPAARFLQTLRGLIESPNA